MCKNNKTLLCWRKMVGTQQVVAKEKEKWPDRQTNPPKEILSRVKRTISVHDLVKKKEKKQHQKQYLCNNKI